MTEQGFLQIVIYIVTVLLLAKPMGSYMARVYQNKSVGLNRWFAGFEMLLYRLSGIKPEQEMRWTQYAMSMLALNLLGALVVYALQRWQDILPLNPQALPAVTPDSSFNTAASFATNTNWQGYSGEATMSYLTQMLGMTVQNFMSAASSMAVLVALIRAFTSRHKDTIGNFWVDMTRSTLYILLPLSFLFALVLVSQGVVQTFNPYQAVALQETVSYSAPKLDADGKAVVDTEGKPVTEAVSTQTQTLALGPAASQIAIKQLGSNGGGFFNVNSAHPYENPTPLSNFLEMLAILLIPAASCYTFGAMKGDTRQGWTLLAAMSLVLIPLIFVAVSVEQSGNPALTALGVDQIASAQQAGGNMEGKEARFGIVNSALWSVATTATTNGSVSSMHDSFMPISGLVLMWLIELGEVIFGGVGSGLYGMVVYALIAVFLAGLMIGRSPEYLGKKVEAFEIKMAGIVILVPSLMALGGAAIALMLDVGKASIFNPGAHGYSEVLYAFSSAGFNNGSAFGGLSANVPFYNTMLGIGLLFGRYWVMIPVLAIAGSLAAKKTVPEEGPGTLSTHTPLFVMLLIGTVLMVGALTFVPALALGPAIEHLQMISQH